MKDSETSKSSVTSYSEKALVDLTAAVLAVADRIEDLTWVQFEGDVQPSEDNTTERFKHYQNLLKEELNHGKNPNQDERP